MKWPEITADTPIEEVQRIHKQIWDFVIEYGRKPKTPYECDCACCEYALKLKSLIGSHDFICNYCPFEKERCNRYGSLFGQYFFTPDSAKKKELAALIRDIPFKSFEEITYPIIERRSL